jgi:predicted Fe-Mo cluster-binding NifX family protein
MTTRIVIPVEDENGLESHVAQHFGRAPYFAVVDLENGQLTNITIQSNTGEHTGGIGSPHDNLLALKPNAIIVFGMGPRGLQSFQSSNITVLKADSDHVRTSKTPSKHANSPTSPPDANTPTTTTNTATNRPTLELRCNQRKKPSYSILPTQETPKK